RFRAVPEKLLARDANACTTQPGGIEARAVVATGERTQQCRGIGDSARHRSGGILTVRNRNDAGAVDETERRFHADERAGARRADDRAVGLGADADRREARGDRRTGPGARAARIAIQRVRIRTLPAPRAPAAGGPR